MLLISNKLFLILLTIIFLSSCSNKNNYSSNSYKKTRYEKLKKQDMKNSKAMHRATMRSYVIRGKRYYPTKTYIGKKFSGIASWYGPDFHAKLTSNGELYDMYGQTAASKTLPMNTMVKVYNKDNGKSTIVRINDRGPFIQKRIIDLSNKAAHDIDMVKKGTANIELEVIGFDGKVSNLKNDKLYNKYSAKYYLQVGVFSKIAGAKSVKKEFNMILENNYRVIIKQDKINNKRVNRVLISGFRSQEEALDFKKENDLNNAILIAH